MKAISKSQFNLSQQCDKAFWLYRHRKELISFTAAQEKVMKQGSSFGELMQQCFPGGIDVSKEATYFSQRINLTRDLIFKAQAPIYEATLSTKVKGVPLLCMVDVLVPDQDGWHLYEVKSATSVKPEYIGDAAFQKFVAEQMGLNIKSVNIVHVNNQYERIGALEIHKLGKVARIDEHVQNSAIDFEPAIENLEAIDAGKLPRQNIGAHCFKPYACAFMEHCWLSVPKEDSVFDFFSLSKALELFEQGWSTVSSIPADHPFQGKSDIRFKAYQKEGLQVNKQDVQSFLDELQYPLCYLDFETFMSAVPKFDYSRPYQQICFQYSLHMQESESSEIKHIEFLASAEGDDPRIPFINRLVEDIGDSGSIVVYNAAFEKTRLKEIGENFPQYKEACEEMIHRMVDLYEPFRDLSIYHPDMKGSASIKAVLPALVPELSYKDLDIADGGAAMTTFENMIDGIYTAEETHRLRTALLKYCELDTWAMVKLVEKLEGYV